MNTEHQSNNNYLLIYIERQSIYCMVVVASMLMRSVQALRPLNDMNCASHYHSDLCFVERSGALRTHPIYHRGVARSII